MDGGARQRGGEAARQRGGKAARSAVARRAARRHAAQAAFLVLLPAGMDDGSCIVLGGEVCGGLGLCVGNGTCACLPGYSQTLEFHYLGAWDGVESAPCSNRESVHILLVLILAVYSCGLAFQLFITRTLPQLVRAAPTIVGYLLIITPTLVRLAQWGSADMGIMTSAG